MSDTFSETNTRSRFGNAIRRRRAELGISQEELAQHAGMTRTYVGEIETGRRNPALLNIEKLARALGVSVAALFSEYGADYQNSDASRGITLEQTNADGA